MRILELVYRLAPSGDSGAIDARHALEKQMLQGLSLVEVAARCAEPVDLLERIDAMTRAFAFGEPADEGAYRAFEERFWRACWRPQAEPHLRDGEVAWWYRVLGERPRMERYVPSPVALRVAFYRELARRLAKDQAPALFYLTDRRSVAHRPPLPADA